jgi:ABC-type spermidine/putrescine transport system permease subunit II
MPFFALFTVVNIAFIVWAEKWDAMQINHLVIVFGNALLFLLTMFTLWLHLKAINNKNPNVLLRSVMLSTFIKLIVMGVGVLLYVAYIPKENRSRLTIIAIMILYLCYTMIEVKAILKKNKKKTAHANN